MEQFFLEKEISKLSFTKSQSSSIGLNMLFDK